MNYLFETQDLPLTQFATTFAQASVWLDEGLGSQIATFDLVVRDMPKDRNYLVAGGLKELIEYIKNLKYTDNQIRLLKRGKLITNKFIYYLKNFRFSGDIYAMPEGTIFFPGEPIIRVTAPLIEAALVEIALFNITTSNVIFLSKASRIKSVLKNISVVLGMQRGHSFESGMKGLRSGYICGLLTTGWPNFVQKYGLEQSRGYLVSGQHSFIKSFPSEIDAFRKLALAYPNNAAFMIDTYDFEKGLDNAIVIGKELQAQGNALRFVTIDSGDLNKLSKMARKKLDENGLQKVKILAATNMDEKKIKKLVDFKTPINCFIVATEYVTVRDAPCLEVVYKMGQIEDGGTIRYTAKLTPGKMSYPGKKQVFRTYKNGKILKDVVGLDDEDYGTPLLLPIFKKGKLVYPIPSLDKIRDYFKEQFSTIPEKLLNVEKDITFNIKISSGIKRLLEIVKKQYI